jgi:hypothetical protein
MMELHLKRTDCGPECSIGTLYVDGRRQCYTLEDADREKHGRPVAEWKVTGATAIPRGCYRVTRTYSNRFKAVTPFLHNVPGYLGVRIIAERQPRIVDGCILVGASRTDFRSRLAYSVLDARIAAALARGEQVWLEIT